MDYMDWKQDKLYQKYLILGYKEWESKAQKTLKGTPYFVQKGFIEGNTILFFITVYVYLHDDGKIGYRPEIQFRTKDKKYIEVMVIEDNVTPTWLEKFCMRLYRQMECLPYGKKDS
ncbi:MAG TPA: hypothetical protein VI727_08060 [Candidatus Brocadiaceae bacterium]|nr:hypothetical protein [Candidatus Brocadiaceae bacterium]